MLEYLIWTCYHFPFYVNNEEKYFMFVLKTYISQEFIFSDDFVGNF